MEISNQTARSRLKETNLTSRRPVLAPRLTRYHKIAPLVFARTRCDGRVRVYRRPDKRYSEVIKLEVDRFWGGSVMVWGDISIDDRINYVVVPQHLNVKIYVDAIMQNHVVPFANNFDNGFILQQNCKIHIANFTRNLLKKHKSRW